MIMIFDLKQDQLFTNSWKSWDLATGEPVTGCPGDHSLVSTDRDVLPACPLGFADKDDGESG